VTRDDVNARVEWSPPNAGMHEGEAQNQARKWRRQAVNRANEKKGDGEQGTQDLHHHPIPIATADGDRWADQIRPESCHALHFVAVPQTDISAHSNRHLVTARPR